MSDAFEADGPIKRCAATTARADADLVACEGRGPTGDPVIARDEVATARHAALVSWITVAISLLALVLAYGTVP